MRIYKEVRLLYLFFCFFGCSDTESSTTVSQPKKIEVLRTPKHVSSTKEDYNQKSFLCCTNKNFQKILTTYVDLTHSMALDQEENTLINLSKLQTQILEIEKVDSNVAITTLQVFVQDLQPTSLSELQNNFAPFSTKMVEWFKSITKENQSVIEQKNSVEKEEIDQPQTQKKDNNSDMIRVITGFCPMAPPPGRWLQREDVIQNPFYGSKMLTCGVFE